MKVAGWDCLLDDDNQDGNSQGAVADLRCFSVSDI